MKYLLILILLTFVLSFKLSHGQTILSPADKLAGVATVPVKNIINQLKNSVNEIVSHAGDVIGNQVVPKSVAEINVLIESIKREVGDLNKTVKDVNETAQQLIMKALVTVDMVTYFITTTKDCIVNDFTILLGGLDARITRIVGDALPWANDSPIITNIYERTHSIPFGMRAGKLSLLLIEGYNFIDGSRCHELKVELKDKKGVIVKTNIFSSSRNMILLSVPETVVPGEYALLIDVPQPRLWGIYCSSVRLNNVIKVLPKAEFKIQYEVIPSCRATPVQEFRVGTVNRTNEDCDNEVYVSGNYTLPSGWSYMSHRYELGANRSTMEEDKMVGNTLYVKWRLEKRTKEGIWPAEFCSGARSWVQGHIFMTGSTVTYSPGNKISGNYPNPLSYNETVEILTLQNVECQADAYTIAATITDPSGRSISIPAVSGGGDLTSSTPNGIKMTWNANKRSLYITTLMQCGF